MLGDSILHILPAVLGLHNHDEDSLVSFYIVLLFLSWPFCCPHFARRALPFPFVQSDHGDEFNWLRKMHNVEEETTLLVRKLTTSPACDSMSSIERNKRSFASEMQMDIESNVASH